MNTFKVGDTVRCFQDFAYDVEGSVSVVGQIDKDFFNKFERFYVKEQPKVAKSKRTSAKRKHEENEKRIAWEELTRTYYQNLLDFVFRFSKEEIPGFYISRETDTEREMFVYCFVSEFASYVLPEELPSEYSSLVFQNYYFIKGKLERFDLQKSEKERVEKIRSQALGKLTDEEKEILGLI